MFRALLSKGSYLVVFTLAIVAIAGCASEPAEPEVSTGAALPSQERTVDSEEREPAAIEPSREAEPAEPPAETAVPQPSPAAEEAEQPPPPASVEPAPVTVPASEAPQAASPEPALAPAASAAATVQISIVGDKEKGTILEPTAVELQDNDTVIDVLKRVAKEHKLQLETRGVMKVVYVEGISNLYEFDKGARSGWLYSVNGEFPSAGAGAYELKPNDQIRWLYTEDLGKDVGKDGNADSEETAE